MKVIKKNVYYCDYCKKRGLSKGHMRSHEQGCTANPNRYCKLCDRVGIIGLVNEFKARFIMHKAAGEEEWQPDYFRVEWLGSPVTLDEIQKSVEYCPNCVLSILRQTKMNYQCFGLEPFDYKEELKREFSERNARNIENIAWY